MTHDGTDSEKSDGKRSIGRDGSGRFVSGNPGGPGRGKFVDENGNAIGWGDVRAELLRQWGRHGATVLDRLRKRSPLAWARLVLQTLAPKSVDVQLGTGDSGKAGIELVFQLDKPPEGNEQMECYEQILAEHNAQKSASERTLGTQAVSGLPDAANSFGDNGYERLKHE